MTYKRRKKRRNVRYCFEVLDVLLRLEALSLGSYVLHGGLRIPVKFYNFLVITYLDPDPDPH
jgi:hypothetical protein